MKEIKSDREKAPWKKWLFYFSLGFILILIYKVLDNFTDIGNWIDNLFKVLSPFLWGILIAYILYLPCRWFETKSSKSKVKILKKRKKGLSILIVYVITIFLIVLAFRFIIPRTISGVVDFSANIEEYYKSAIEGLDNIPEDSFLKGDTVNGIIDSIQNINIDQFINQDKLLDYAKSAFNVVKGIFSLCVAIIISIYILLERKNIKEFLKKFGKATFKPETYERLAIYCDKSNDTFFKYLGSQLIDAIIVGILITVAMLIMGVDYAYLLGPMVGLFNLIPYFGAIIGCVVAILVTILTGGLPKAIVVAIVIIILQQIDANIINPRIVGNSLKVSPILVIFAVTIGGAYFGIIGMFLAVPIATVIKAIIEEYIENKEKEKEDNKIIK